MDAPLAHGALFSPSDTGGEVTVGLCTSTLALVQMVILF